MKKEDYFLFFIIIAAIIISQLVGPPNKAEALVRYKVTIDCPSWNSTHESKVLWDVKEWAFLSSNGILLKTDKGDKIYIFECPIIIEEMKG